MPSLYGTGNFITDYLDIGKSIDELHTVFLRVEAAGNFCL